MHFTAFKYKVLLCLKILISAVKRYNCFKIQLEPAVKRFNCFKILVPAVKRYVCVKILVSTVKRYNYF